MHIHEKAPDSIVPKYIHSVIDDQPVVTETQLRFWEWISTYYLCSLGEVMDTALPGAMKLTSETRLALNPLINPVAESFDEREEALFHALMNKPSVSLQEASHLLGIADVLPFIRGLIDRRVILPEEEVTEKYKPHKETFIRLTGTLAENDDQLRNLFDVLEKKARSQFRVFMHFLRYAGNTPLREVIMSRKELLSRPDVTHAAIQQLVKKGIFSLEEQTVDREKLPAPSRNLQQILFSEPQQKAIDEINEEFLEKDIVLLFGVTASGKTMVYFHLIHEALSRGEQVLVLLPEVSITRRVLEEYAAYFGDQMVTFYSRMQPAGKKESWDRILSWKPVKKGKGQLILGSRSAILLPFSIPSLIIVDDEHDHAYKQYQSNPRFQARDAVIYLARLYAAKVLLGSASPSFESYYNAKSGRFGLVELTERYGNFITPRVVMIDIADELRQGKMQIHFSSVLLEQLNDAVKKGFQALLFQNRRGFAIRIQCSSCKWIPECKHCDVTLIYHKKFNELRCHYCGYAEPAPPVCPECGSPDLKMIGFGTEKIEEDLALLMPGTIIRRLDLDIARSKQAYHKIIDEFDEGKTDVLIGTQMIIKGLNFSKVSLTAILNADNMLSFPDFRSWERAFQLLIQVSGRSGRMAGEGMFIIQTFKVNHPVIKTFLSGDYHDFFKHQLEDRRKYLYPPYYRLIRLRLRHKDPKILEQGSSLGAKELRSYLGKHVLGPEYPVISRIRDYYIRHILIKMERDSAMVTVKKKIQESIRQFLKENSKKHILLDIDVDPQ